MELIQREIERRRADDILDRLLEQDEFRAEFVTRLKDLMRDRSPV